MTNVLDEMLKLKGFEKVGNLEENDYYWVYETKDDDHTILTIEVDKDFTEVAVFENDERTGGYTTPEAIAKYLIEILK